jgi:hypothetical protein
MTTLGGGGREAARQRFEIGFEIGIEIGLKVPAEGRVDGG